VGLPGRAAKTIEVNRDALRPVLARIGARPLQDLTAADVRAVLTAMADTYATRTVQKAHTASPAPFATPRPRTWCAETSPRWWIRLAAGRDARHGR
jgi:hypothetical protein